MKVLITGSSGFIGSHLMERLLKSHHEVLGIDRHRPGDPAHEPFWQPCDVLEETRLIDLVHQAAAGAVIHLAARTDLAESRNISGYEANIAGVENVLAALEECASVSRVIFTSSQLVCRVGYRPLSPTDYCPETLYGQSKVLGERAVRQQDGGGRTWCIVRPTTVWGPGMNAHYRRFLVMVKNGRYRHVGRRACRKSWGYVGNIAYQYEKLLEAPAADIHRKVFYLADYEPIALRDWTDALQAELGAKPIKTVPEPAAWLVAKAGDLLNNLGFQDVPFNSFRLRNVLTETVLDLKQTEKVCGNLPYSMKEGIRETVCWFNRCEQGRTPVARTVDQRAV